MLYKITSTKDKKGKEKTDQVSAKRMKRNYQSLVAGIGTQALLYCPSEDKFLSTSTVRDIAVVNNVTTLYTENTIYEITAYQDDPLAVTA